MNEQVKNTENVTYMDINCLNCKESGLLYFKMPQFLMTEHFADLSTDGKVIYSIMLNRLQLSAKNGWQKNNQFYIYFSIETVQKLIHCGKTKAIRVMKELKTYRLIEGVRCDDHRRTMYFFHDVSEYMGQREIRPENVPQSDNFSQDSYPQNFTQESEATAPTDHKEVTTGFHSEPVRSENETCTSLESEPVQVSNVNPKKTEYNKTDISYKDYSHKDHHQERKAWRRRRTKEELKRDFIETWKNEDAVVMYSQEELTSLDRLIDLVSTALSRRSSFNINGTSVDTEDIYCHFMCMGTMELGYTMDYLQHESYHCTNFVSYAISVLYNAPEEAEEYYVRKVEQDMKQEKWSQGIYGGYGYAGYSYAG